MTKNTTKTTKTTKGTKATKARKAPGSSVNLATVPAEQDDAKSPAKVKLTVAQRKALRHEKRVARRALRKATRRAEQAKNFRSSLATDRKWAREMAEKVVKGTAGAKTERLVAMAWALNLLGQ